MPNNTKDGRLPLTPEQLSDELEDLICLSEALAPASTVNIYSELLLPNVRTVDDPGTHPLLAWEILRETHRFIVWGSPGSGKSTLLRRLFIEHRDAFLNGEIDSALPLYWQVRRWRGGEIVDELIESSRTYDREVDVDRMLEALGDGRIILLLDAIDEIDSSMRVRLEHSVRTLIQTYPALRMGITSRPLPAFIPEGFVHFELSPLDDKQIAELISRQIASLDLPSENKSALLHVIAKDRQIRELVRNPLLLSALIMTHKDERVPPKSRAQILLEMVDVLLRNWDKVRTVARGRSSSNDKMRAAGLIAIYMLRHGRPQLTNYELIELLQRLSLPDEFKAELAALPLFVQNRFHELEFSHASLRDICAAHLASEKPEYATEIQDRTSDWPQVASLLKELLHKAPIDVLLCIAAIEEFAAVRSLLEPLSSIELPDVSVTIFLGNIFSPASGRDVRIAVISGGMMGTTQMETAISAAVSKLAPANMVMLGLASSLSSDLALGDVFIPDSVDEYRESSPTNKRQSRPFQTSGNGFQASKRLLNRFQLFEHAHSSYYSSWRTDAAGHMAELLDASVERASYQLIPQQDRLCRLFVGDGRKLATASALTQRKPFVEWITRAIDHNVAAITMESASASDAALIRDYTPRMIGIYGVCEYAETRKEGTGSAAKTRSKQLAARNALSLLIRGIQAGLLETDISTALEATSGTATVAQSRLKSVFVIGGTTAETSNPNTELPRLYRASVKLGKLIASAGAQLIICSPFPDSVDYHVATGYAAATAKGTIHMHHPSHPTVISAKDAFVKLLRREDLVFQDWRYPGPDDSKSWSQAWLLAQLQALERTDLVVALGGKVSKSANTLLHIAEAKRLPIVPFTFLGGAAKRAFDRQNWKRTFPSFASIMEHESGIDQTIEIANDLILARTRFSSRSVNTASTLFVSFSRKDRGSGEAVVDFLKRRGLEVLTGDDEVNNGQMIESSIERAILRSQVCIVLWSQNYAMSPWCYDELMLASNLKSRDQISIWLFNLDDSLIVPTAARKLSAISTRTPSALVAALDGLLSSGSDADR